jgi:hypothetical protein
MLTQINKSITPFFLFLIVLLKINIVAAQTGSVEPIVFLKNFDTAGKVDLNSLHHNRIGNLVIEHVSPNPDDVGSIIFHESKFLQSDTNKYWQYYNVYGDNFKPASKFSYTLYANINEYPGTPTQNIGFELIIYGKKIKTIPFPSNFPSKTTKLNRQNWTVINDTIWISYYDINKQLVIAKFYDNNWSQFSNKIISNYPSLLNVIPLKNGDIIFGSDKGIAIYKNNSFASYTGDFTLNGMQYIGGYSFFSNRDLVFQNNSNKIYRYLSAGVFLTLNNGIVGIDSIPGLYQFVGKYMSNKNKFAKINSNDQIYLGFDSTIFIINNTKNITNKLKCKGVIKQGKIDEYNRLWFTLENNSRYLYKVESDFAITEKDLYQNNKIKVDLNSRQYSKHRAFISNLNALSTGEIAIGSSYEGIDYLGKGVVKKYNKITSKSSEIDLTKFRVNKIFDDYKQVRWLILDTFDGFGWSSRIFICDLTVDFQDEWTNITNRIKNSLINQTDKSFLISSYILEGNNNVWFGTYDQGVIVYNYQSKIFKNYILNNLIYTKVPYLAYNLINKKVYIYSVSAGLQPGQDEKICIYLNGNFTLFTKLNGLVSYNLFSANYGSPSVYSMVWKNNGYSGIELNEKDSIVASFPMANYTSVTNSNSGSQFVTSLNNGLMMYNSKGSFWKLVLGADIYSATTHLIATESFHDGTRGFWVLVNDNTPTAGLVFIPCLSDQTNVSINHRLKSNNTNSILYPNPCINEILLKVQSNEIGNYYRICNEMGQDIKIGKIESTETLISLEHLSIGIYYIVIKGVNQYTMKFIKE